MSIHAPMAVLLQGENVIREEIGRLQRNFQGLIWGFAAAWVILMLYTLMIVVRERKIRREMERLKHIVEDAGNKS